MVAASAPATKKMKSSKIAASDVIRGSGYACRKVKRPTAGSLWAAMLIVPPDERS
jgi:hypothetical protein